MTIQNIAAISAAQSNHAGQDRQATPAPSATAATHRTPYHALAADSTPVVPDWAQHRSVYRAAGRTLYLVETDQLESARHDLDILSRNGWDVQVARAGENANITMSRTAA